MVFLPTSIFEKQRNVVDVAENVKELWRCFHRNWHGRFCVQNNTRVKLLQKLQYLQQPLQKGVSVDKTARGRVATTS